MFATKFVDIKTQFLALQNIFIYDCDITNEIYFWEYFPQMLFPL